MSTQEKQEVIMDVNNEWIKWAIKKCGITIVTIAHQHFINTIYKYPYKIYQFSNLILKYSYEKVKWATLFLQSDRSRDIEYFLRGVEYTEQKLQNINLNANCDFIKTNNLPQQDNNQDTSLKSILSVNGESQKN